MILTIGMKLIAIAMVINQRMLKHNYLISRDNYDKAYDYIVVGAGSAGCVVAARLAEDISSTVLLIEAGGAQNMDTDMPALVLELQKTEMNWNYPIVKQNNTLNKNLRSPRGRVFGGSSVLNGMNYYRGSPEDFDLWGYFYGLKNWKYRDVLPYFKKSENNLDEDIIRNNSDFHNTGGPLSVSTADKDLIIDKILENYEFLGYNKTISDGRNPFGYTLLQRTIKDGVRQSSATAFLESDQKRNLHTIGNSTVTKIIFNDKKRAIGVFYVLNEKIRTVYVKKEIIISAGPIGSPKLLMLSGIGPKDHLEKLNMTVVSDLRVGDNLGTPLIISINYNKRNLLNINENIFSFDNIYKYYVKNNGPLTLRVDSNLCFNDLYYDKFPQISNGCILTSMFNKFFSVSSIVRKPKSRGTVRLRSRNPFDDPLIDPCLFCDQSDLEILVETVKKSLNIFQRPYIQQFVSISNFSIPGCNPCPDYYFCDEFIRCIVRNYRSPIYPMGTCKMGPKWDNNAVVDEKLRVRGVYGLRVIDSSVVPDISDHTNAISIMIGERGADFIKDFLNNYDRSEL